MSDMYEKTQNKKKKITSRKIGIIVGAVVAFLVFVIIFCAIPIVKNRMYWGFISDLSADTSRFSKKDLVECTINGEKFNVDTDDCFTLYKKLGYREDVDTQLSPLEPQDGMTIKYANGSMLYIWPLEESDKSGIGLLYEGAAGRKYSYISDEIKYSSILNAVMSEE